MIIPSPFQIKSIVHESSDVYSLALTPVKGEIPAFIPGQFNMLYLYGFGEIALSDSSHPFEKQQTYHTIHAVGSITKAMQHLKEGDQIGMRGPFGSHWPVEKKDCNVLVVAGGIGLTAMRSVLFYLGANREQYKKITVLYGTRTPDSIIYRNEMKQWQEQDIEMQVSVDEPDANWNGHVGVVTSLIPKHLPSPKNTLVLVCGPEIMIKASLSELKNMGIDPKDVYVSMERNMQCAVGFCGHCQYGPYFLCKDGPIFSYEQVQNFLDIEEL